MIQPRKTPYTRAGIKRVPCAHCGKPSIAQWRTRACALGGPDTWQGLCAKCDRDLNIVVLKFFRVPGVGRLMTRYDREP